MLAPKRIIFSAALAMLAVSVAGQTQEEIDAYPDYAENFNKHGMTWEPIKVHTEDGYTLTMFHVTGTTEGGPIEVTKPAVIMQHGMGGSGLGWTYSMRNEKVEPMAF